MRVSRRRAGAVTVERWAQREGAVSRALMDGYAAGGHALLAASQSKLRLACLHWLALLAGRRAETSTQRVVPDKRWSTDAICCRAGGPLSPARIQAILNDVCHCRGRYFM
ncbi:hypothetical protein KCP71_21565 [Salmonella enterica subsp. enterica]|nr:hypothetical protein KCP71_21565 [Salmonella enterica subsp. enterica]